MRPEGDRGARANGSAPTRTATIRGVKSHTPKACLVGVTRRRDVERDGADLRGDVAFFQVNQLCLGAVILGVVEYFLGERLLARGKVKSAPHTPEPPSSANSSHELSLRRFQPDCRYEGWGSSGPVAPPAPCSVVDERRPSSVPGREERSHPSWPGLPPVRDSCYSRLPTRQSQSGRCSREGALLGWAALPAGISASGR
jgi:hypothetical protein